MRFAKATTSLVIDKEKLAAINLVSPQHIIG
jgi:hypothetical protein